MAAIFLANFSFSILAMTLLSTQSFSTEKFANTDKHKSYSAIGPFICSLRQFGPLGQKPKR